MQNKFDQKNYNRIWMQAKRALADGFDVDVARQLYKRLIDRGIPSDDARWAVMDAASRGCFGYIPESKNAADPATPEANQCQYEFSILSRIILPYLHKTL